jgi:F-type H+-transporting ATPase subunit delta
MTAAVPTVLDPEAVSLGRVYAEALADALPPGLSTADVETQLLELADMLKQVRGADELFTAVGRNARRRVAMVRRIFDNRLDEPLVDLLCVLAENHRLTILPALAEQFHRLLDERAHRVEITVRSAVELSPEQHKRLEQLLADALGVEPALEVIVQPDLVAGLTVQVGDTVYDASLAGELSRLGKAVARAALRRDVTAPQGPKPPKEEADEDEVSS